MLVIREVCRSFREGERVHRVLDGASATLEAGQIAAIVGRSGSGKSTLLNLISGIDRPDAGTIELDGREITSLREPDRTLFRRRHIGFVYQFFNLVPTLTAGENVRLALELDGVPRDAARQRTLAMLDHVGLREREESAPDALSGGEQQRIAIARALVHEPRVVLADEPTGNLDEQTAQIVLPLLLRLARERGATLVIVTHDPAVRASADRVFELRDGRLLEQV